MEASAAAAVSAPRGVIAEVHATRAADDAGNGRRSPGPLDNVLDSGAEHDVAARSQGRTCTCRITQQQGGAAVDVDRRGRSQLGLVGDPQGATVDRGAAGVVIGGARESQCSGTELRQPSCTGNLAGDRAVTRAGTVIDHGLGRAKGQHTAGDRRGGSGGVQDHTTHAAVGRAGRAAVDGGGAAIGQRECPDPQRIRIAGRRGGQGTGDIGDFIRRN